MTGQTPVVVGTWALRPDPFPARPDCELTDEALQLYNDIYATGSRRPGSGVQRARIVRRADA